MQCTMQQQIKQIKHTKQQKTTDTESDAMLAPTPPTVQYRTPFAAVHSVFLGSARVIKYLKHETSTARRKTLDTKKDRIFLPWPNSRKMIPSA
ncbi:hypothetical protein VTN49DRAFT_1639 [Thermomyces lanuginosus]|uniref:uncharacterized protein n=1 Tax=Thermomyces lanuginosus TaxID=5541 RepID=UPI003743C101